MPGPAGRREHVRSHISMSPDTLAKLARLGHDNIGHGYKGLGWHVPARTVDKSALSSIAIDADNNNRRTLA